MFYRYNFLVVGGGRPVERPALPLIHGVHIGAVLDEQLHQVQVAGVGGHVEAGPARPVRDVDVGEAGNDELHTTAGIVRRGNVEGGLPVSVPIKKQELKKGFKVDQCCGEETIFIPDLNPASERVSPGKERRNRPLYV